MICCYSLDVIVDRMLINAIERCVFGVALTFDFKLSLHEWLLLFFYYSDCYYDHDDYYEYE